MSETYFAKKINLGADEKIQAILHHHPITYLKQFIIAALLILLAFFMMFYFLSLGRIGAALFLALLVTGIFYGSREFFIWYNNVFIITNERVVDTDQKGFFHKTVSEIGYDKINDISYSVHGFVQTIFKLGTIKIQATGATLILRNLKQPGQINQLLVGLIKNQTGKKIDIKQVNNLNSLPKEQLIEDFLNQEEMAKYEDYNLNELVEEFKDSLGEIRLKKLLVDELEKQDTSLAEASESEDDETVNNFKHRQL